MTPAAGAQAVPSLGSTDGHQLRSISVSLESLTSNAFTRTSPCSKPPGKACTVLKKLPEVVSQARGLGPVVGDVRMYLPVSSTRRVERREGVGERAPLPPSGAHRWQRGFDTDPQSRHRWASSVSIVFQARRGTWGFQRLQCGWRERKRRQY